MITKTIRIIHSVLQNVRHANNFYWRTSGAQRVASMQISPVESEGAAGVRSGAMILDSFFRNNHSKHPVARDVQFSAENTHHGSIVHFSLPASVLHEDAESGLQEFLRAEQENFAHRLTTIVSDSQNRIEFPAFVNESEDMLRVLKYMTYTITAGKLILPLHPPIQATYEKPEVLKGMFALLHPNQDMQAGLSIIRPISEEVTSSNGVVSAQFMTTEKNQNADAIKEDKKQSRMIFLPGLT